MGAENKCCRAGDNLINSIDEYFINEQTQMEGASVSNIQHKFRIADAKTRETALGRLDELPVAVSTLLEGVRINSQPIRAPRTGEWLDAHPYEGQTYKVYISRAKMGEGKWPDEKRNVIYL